MTASSQDYFQQEVKYFINVTLDDTRHDLNGYESILYKNNSQDTLRFIYFHLWPNAYSGNKTELAGQLMMLNGKSRLFRDPELRGYIDSLEFMVDGKTVQWDLLPGLPDICKIILSKPIIHGDSIQITTPFHVKIPSATTSLLGHNGQSYNISQWYPKPAVYDRAGWHQMPYLDQGEFFSEFGNFDVSITLPDNYIVAATGNLMSEEEKKMLDILAEETSRMKISVDKKSGFAQSSKKMKTLRYTANQVHDFAWFADKRFLVKKGIVKLPDSGREITTWIMFTPQEMPLWIDALSYADSSIYFFSKLIGDYPYDSYTAVQSVLSGGAGMEYPGVSVIGITKDPYLLEEVIAHEICHNWFYSAIGTDERTFPYMDESIVGSYESRYMEKRFPHKKLWEIYFRKEKVADLLGADEIPVQRIEETEWLMRARTNSEQPVNLPAPDYSRVDYNTMVYNKGAHGFTWLRLYLSDQIFDSIMHDYYIKWKNKHPGPDDLRAQFENATGKDLSWFFDDFLSTTKRLDYKIVSYKNHNLLIKSKGEMMAPLLVTEMSGDSVLSENWIDGFNNKKLISFPSANHSEIKIDPEHRMPELFRLNNNIRNYGLFRRSDPLQIGFLYSYEKSDKRSLTFVPVVDWTSTDGFMAGVALHNGMLIPKPMDYIVIPFYTFKSPGIVGYGKISFNFIPYDNIIRTVKFTLEGSQFGAPGDQNFKNRKAGIELYFRPGRRINPLNQKLFGYYVSASDLYQIELQTQAKMLSYIQLGYGWDRSSVVNPFRLIIFMEYGKSYQKTSLELSYKYSYYGINNGLEIRFFAGTMLKDQSSYPFYSFSPSGRNGHELYLYEGIFPDRFGEYPETFWSRQMNLSEGKLVTPVSNSLGYSRSVCSISLNSTLPGKASRIPVKPFMTLLLNDNSEANGNKSPLFFEAGFKAGLWNFFEIYFPLLVSDNISSIYGSLNDRIRFTFALNIINPLRF
jgi:hypothetical protein